MKSFKKMFSSLNLFRKSKKRKTYKKKQNKRKYTRRSQRGGWGGSIIPTTNTVVPGIIKGGWGGVIVPSFENSIL